MWYRYRMTKQLRWTAARSELSDCEGSILSEWNLQACVEASAYSVSLCWGLFALIALPALSKAAASVWATSPMPCQSESLLYVHATTCHCCFCSPSVNTAQPLPLTSPNCVWSPLSCEERIVDRKLYSSHFEFATCYWTGGKKKKHLRSVFKGYHKWEAW